MCPLFSPLTPCLILNFCVPMMPQPAPASAGEESEEDQQFRTIFQEIAGDVSSLGNRQRQSVYHRVWVFNNMTSYFQCLCFLLIVVTF